MQDATVAKKENLGGFWQNKKGQVDIVDKDNQQGPTVALDGG